MKVPPWTMVLANLAEVTELDDLEQGVLMTEVRKTSSNIADGAPSFSAPA